MLEQSDSFAFHIIAYYAINRKMDDNYVFCLGIVTVDSTHVSQCLPSNGVWFYIVLLQTESLNAIGYNSLDPTSWTRI